MNINDIMHNGIHLGYTGATKEHIVIIDNIGVVFRSPSQRECNMFIAELKCRLMSAESQQTEINNLKARLARVTDE